MPGRPMTEEQKRIERREKEKENENDKTVHQ